MSSSLDRAKIPEAFAELLDEARYKTFYGGRGGGKSWSFALVLLIIGMQRPIRVLCTREVQKSIKQSVHQLLRDTINRYPLMQAHYKVMEAEIRGLNGTEFYFHGLHNQTADSLKSFEGVDYCWIEEAHSVSQRSFEILAPTIRKEGSEIWISFNPRLATDYVYKIFVTQGRANSIVKKVGWQDNPYFTSVLDEERRAMLEADPEAYAHIWEGELDTRFSGAIFAKYLDRLQQNGGIRDARLFDAALPVHTAWDLGVGDSTAIWLFQLAGREIRVIDYHEDSGVGMPTYVEWLEKWGNEHNATWGDDWVPHDAKVREWLSDGKSRVEALVEMGRNPRVVPMHKVEDGIEATRKLIPDMIIDSGNCEAGLDALMQYAYEYDEDRKVYKTRPAHNWSSHAADAFRYLSVGVKQQRPEPPKPKPDMRGMNEITYDELMGMQQPRKRERI